MCVVKSRVVPISIVRARRALRARPNVPRKAIAKIESAGMKLNGSAHDDDCRRHTGPAAPVMSLPHAVPFCGRYETITLVHDLMKKTLPASTRLSLTKAFAPPDWLMPNTAVCTGSHDLTSRLGSLVTRAPIGCVLVRLLLGLLRPFVWGWQTPFAWKTRSRRWSSTGNHTFRKHYGPRAALARASVGVQHLDNAGIYQIAPKVIAETHKEWRERLAAFELEPSRSAEK